MTSGHDALLLTTPCSLKLLGLFSPLILTSFESISCFENKKKQDVWIYGRKNFGRFIFVSRGVCQLKLTPKKEL